MRPDLSRPVEEVAPLLLGALLTRGGVTIRLTEVEAYGGADDPGSHAHRGRTPRTATMFGPPGRLYVYFVYGMHWCANLVTGPDGTASAVLLRAGEVVRGHSTARARRPGVPDVDLARGPARLARTLGLSGVDDGSPASLRSPAGADTDPLRVMVGPRVGVGGAGAATPWRFWLAGDPTVSAYRRWVSRGATRRNAVRP